MFGYDNVRTEVVVLSDPQADGTYVIWKAPARLAKVEILAAWAVTDTAFAGAGTNMLLQLLDRGASGTATVGTMSAALGATGTFAGDWTANVPRAFTISEGTLDGGDYMCLKYEESGTVAPLNITVGFTWVAGVGA